MECFKCHNSIDDKKFNHPILQDEYLCVHCFDEKVFGNCAHLYNHINVSFGTNLTNAGRKDDLNIDLILCTVGSNKNKDGFLEEDLANDYQTARNQRLDWEHTDEVIGVITQPEFVSASNLKRMKELGVSLNKSFIVISGLIWKIWNQDRSSEIIKRYVAGSLYGSMEDFFDYAQCSNCGNSYVFKDDYCDHLKGRFNKNNESYRILRGNKFVGAAVVKNPADRDSIGIAVAQDRSRYSVLTKLLNPDLHDYYLYMKKKMGQC